jgi:hypothetical protein
MARIRGRECSPFVAEETRGRVLRVQGILRRLPDALERLYKSYRVVLKSIIMQVQVREN